MTKNRARKEVMRMAKRSGRSGGRKSSPKYRRADTGRYTTPGFAKRHPKTTVKESK
jgi:hypothetical protein